MARGPRAPERIVEGTDARWELDFGALNPETPPKRLTTASRQCAPSATSAQNRMLRATFSNSANGSG